jgi:RNA polymerase sigma-70 factor, ECF subfamily
MLPRPSAGPVTALEAIYRKHQALVRWVLRARGVPEASLDDRVHDVFLAIFRRLPERDPSVPMRAWVAGVARNVGFSHRRSVARQRNRTERMVPPDDPPRPDEVLERREAWRALEGFLDDLGPEQREIFVMVEVTGMRVSELAESMGMPANTLHSRLKVARTRFSQRFAGIPEPPAELLARACQERGRADAKQRRRTWSMIVASSEGLRALPPASALAGASAKAAGWIGAPKLTAVTLAAVLGVAVVAALRAPTVPAADRPPARAAERDAPKAEEAPARDPSVAAAPRVAPPPALERPAPAAREASPTARPRSRTRPPAPAVDVDADLVRATAVLERARDELEAGRAREALAALDEPGARFGALDRERHRLALAAACRLDDPARARRAAVALVRLGAAADPEAPCSKPLD